MSRWSPAVGLMARLIVGAVLIVAGYLKLSDPAGMVRAVRAYRLLPESVVPTLGHLIPMLEVVLGVCLVLGMLTRAAAAVSVALFSAFIFGIAWAWTHGLSIECGCFGGGGTKINAAAGYRWDIIRDLGLVALAGWLVWRPRTYAAVDNLIFRTPLTEGEEA